MGKFLCPVQNKIKVGDRVRIAFKEMPFQKEYKQ